VRGRGEHDEPKTIGHGTWTIAAVASASLTDDRPSRSLARTNVPALERFV